MKQTAVEFLSEKYMYVTWLTNRDEITSSDADKMRIKYLEEAKEMGKQQIIDARLDGCISYSGTEVALISDVVDTEQYYNEQFKNK